MKCPHCAETLLMSQRNNIEIDYCPNCRGVWLDKGELDKLLEYTEQQYIPSPSGQYYNNNPGYSNNKYKNQHGHQKPYKKKSFLGDLFDFD